MLYYIKLKDANNTHPFYNEMGWKDHPGYATVYASKKDANDAAFKEGLDQDEFDIKLLYLRDILDDIRIWMPQYEFIDLVLENNRSKIEQVYKEMRPGVVPKGVYNDFIS